MALGRLTEDSPTSKVLKKADAAAMAKNRGIRVVRDLLELVPRRYLSPSQLTDLRSLRPGEHAFVMAQVARASTRTMRNRRGLMLNVVIEDDDGGTLDLTFFSAHPHVRVLQPGVRGLFWGTVGAYRQSLQLSHPQYEVLTGDEVEQERVEYHRTHLVPVYPTSGSLTSPALHRTVVLALDSVENVIDPVPPEVRRRRGLVDRVRALDLVHRPLVDEDPARGLHRLKYDEAFVLQAILAQRRAAADAVLAVARHPRPDGLLAAFDARLPFELTPEQQQVGEHIAQDMGRERAMNRLLQGEVGSGKTVVALRAMLAAVDAGGQAALLAPTEVLAAQHHRTIETMLGDLAQGGRLGGAEHATRVALLTGSQSTAARTSALLDAASGAAGIVVGTHALIQQSVQFADLALVVVDEQHRFGVEQRDALRSKADKPPHVLVMTATPIPRTVAMTVFGDMDTSTIRSLPRGRSPIQTFVVDAARPGWLERTWQRVAEEVAKGHQAYVVCPRIGGGEAGPPGGQANGGDGEDGEDARANGGDGVGNGGRADASGSRPGGIGGRSERRKGVDDEDLGWDSFEYDTAEGENGEDGDGDGAQASARPMAGVEETFARLSAEPALAGLRLAVLHGRQDPETKDATMAAFTAGRVDVLVSTTVIEVGVDVPNASSMLILDADRFGISQLHQLRGRVGRGSVPGLCLLVTTEPGEPAMERLEAVAATNDGFELAGLDLILRREGDILGSRQSGRRTSVRHLRLGRREDEAIIADAREDVSQVLAADPELLAHPHLAAAVAVRLEDEQAAFLERG